MKRNAKIIIPIILIAAALGIGVGVYFANSAHGDKDLKDGRIPYQEGVVVLEDTMIEPTEDGWIDLTYNYQAYSRDGIHFSCYLTNDASNVYDLYFDIYADGAMRDEIYLSGLLPPGTALQNITLDRELPVGTNEVYVVFNQVDLDEGGNQVIVGQATVTVEFIVAEE